MIDRACISMGTACNLKCRYCHFADKQAETSSFATQDILRIADNIHAYCAANHLPAFKLGLVGAGEPMLHKDMLFALLAHVRNTRYAEMRMYTITNGTTLCAEDIKRLHTYKDCLQVCFSLDGYEQLHNYGRSRYRDVMQSIETYRTVYGASPAINATVHALSIQNKEKLAAFFLDNHLFDVTFSKLVGCADTDLLISDSEFTAFMDYIKGTGLTCRQFRAQRTYDCTMYGRLCGVGRTNIFFTPEGIYPCGRFYKKDAYLLCSSAAPLSEIEKKLQNLTPVQDELCYYRQHLEGHKK